MHACAIWDPHLTKNILAIEGTQKFALRVCLKNWRANYDFSSTPATVVEKEIFKIMPPIQHLHREGCLS